MKEYRFKAKNSVYAILYVLVMGLCILWIAQAKYFDFTAEAAESKINQTKIQFMHGVMEENRQLKKIQSTIVEKFGDGKKTVVVNLLNDGSAKSKAMFRARAKWGDEHLASFEQLLTRESNFNPNVYNNKSQACGLFQALPCSKMPSMDINDQIDWGLNYIEDRYGNPTNAWKHWLARVPIKGKDVGHWY